MTIADWMAAHRNASVDHACQAMMWMGTSLRGMALCALLVVVLCLVLRRPDVIVAGGLAAASAAAASILLKTHIARPRPGPPYAEIAAAGYSMPSTAAAVCTAELLALLLLVPPRQPVWRVVAMGLAIVDAVVGFGLIYLGAHWFSDVCAGILLGGLIGAAAFLATTRVRVRTESPAP